MAHVNPADSCVMNCALSPTAMTKRQSQWKALADQALTRRAGPGWISSTYPSGVLDTLEELIGAEAECCPFLSFEVIVRGEILDVDLRFPIEAESMVSAIIDRGDDAGGS
jgi:hypothetical protein